MAQVQVFGYLGPIRQICRGCPTTTLNEAYIAAVRRFCHESKWYQSTIQGVTILDEPTYNLGSDPYAEIIGVRAISLAETATTARDLIEQSSTLWDPNETHDIPEYFEYTPEGQFSLHPKPNAVYSLRIGLTLQPKINANSIDDSLMNKWDLAFRSGALGYLMRIPGMAWTDKAEANAQETRFMDWINKGASAAEKRYDIGVVPW